MKAALVQLPVQSHDYAYSVENVPLAAGYLASYAASRKSPAEVMICPGATANLGGDAAILAWLGEVRPDVVGFSCYVWNIERTLSLCRMVRQRLERCLIVLGGPEITPDNGFLLGHEDFHVGVVGEGEEAFLDLLHAAGRGHKGMREIKGLMVREGEGWHFTPPRTPVADLEGIPSPYLSGILGASLNRSMILETVRGCPMRCTYCYYHKSSPTVRAFAYTRIQEEFSWACRQGVGEVTLIDPCFARRPDLLELLAAMAETGRGSMPLSCELNAEDLDARLVDALAKAGLRHVEIGLQTVNPKTLKTVGRHFDPYAFARGVGLLRNAGIRVMTDIMVGLPGDSLLDVKRAIDFVLGKGLCDELGVYPLSVLPGTRLRAQAARLGIRFQPTPPYLVLETPDMDCDDIREAFAYAEEETGIDFFPVEAPRKGDRQGPESHAFVHRIVIDSGLNGEPLHPHELGQALCIEVRDPAFLGRREELGKKIRGLLADNPSTLVSWVLPEEAYREGGVGGFIASCCPEIDNPADREYMATFSPRRSCQLFLCGKDKGGGDTLARVPLSPDASRPLWAALSAEAGPDEEQRLAERIGELLGYVPKIRYHDLPEEGADVLDGLLASRVLSSS